MTITDYADAISDRLNADLRPGEPAWSVVRHPRLTDRLLVEQWSDPPRLFSIRWTADSPAPVDVADSILYALGARR